MEASWGTAELLLSSTPRPFLTGRSLWTWLLVSGQVLISSSQSSSAFWKGSSLHWLFIFAQNYTIPKELKLLLQSGDDKEPYFKEVTEGSTLGSIYKLSAHCLKPSKYQYTQKMLAVFFLNVVKKHNVHVTLQNSHFNGFLNISVCGYNTQQKKNLPAIQERWAWSQNWEDPLEKQIATRSSILGWEIPWTEEPGGLTVHGVAKESDMT